MADQTVKNDVKAKKITLPQFFILQNFKKFLRADPELWWCAIFRSRIAHLSWTNFFKYKTLLLLSFTYWPFPFCKVLPVNRQLCRCTICGPKMAHFPPKTFFRKPVNEPCFFHSCQSTCQEWWLKNTEISLAKSHFWL